MTEQRSQALAEPEVPSKIVLPATTVTQENVDSVMELGFQDPSALSTARRRGLPSAAGVREDPLPCQVPSRSSPASGPTCPSRRSAARCGEWGFDGLELASWGDHFDVPAALRDDAYCAGRRELLRRHGLDVWTISNHLVGQAV